MFSSFYKNKCIEEQEYQVILEVKDEKKIISCILSSCSYIT